MRLGKLSFPVKVSPEEIVEQIKGMLEEKEWREFEIQKPELWFFPYWVFNYNAFSESSDEESGAKTVSEGEQGVTAMNARTSELEEEIGSSFDELENELVTKPLEKEFKLVRFRIQLPQAQQLAQLKIAVKLGVTKENVVISGLKAVFFPVWLCDASFEGQQVEFQIDAVSGNVLSEDNVPYRGKTGQQLIGETVDDLRNPLNWFRYLFGIVKDIALFLWNNPFSVWLRTQLATNPRFQIGFLAFIVLLIILNELGLVHFPVLGPTVATAP